jgi:hypothetical protein
MGYGAMHGIPMTASSPMRHEASRGVTMRHDASRNNPVEVHSYEPPWKALCDFALHSDLERLNPNGQPYQNLVNQVFRSLSELLRQQLAKSFVCLSIPLSSFLKIFNSAHTVALNRNSYIFFAVPPTSLNS